MRGRCDASSPHTRTIRAADVAAPFAFCSDGPAMHEAALTDNDPLVGEWARVQPDRSSCGRHVAIGSCLAAFALSVALAVLSDGAHHDDDLTHFLYAQWALTKPAYLVHDWGRPGFTVLYCLPAQLGWTAARIFSGVLTVLAAWLAYGTAARVHLRAAWLVALLALLQPMFFQLGYTTLTETAVAFYVALATWLLITRRFGPSALVFSLTIVTRHEAVVWLPIWAWAFWLGRARWWCYPLLLWAPVVHNLLAPHLFGKTPILLFLEPTANTLYGRGSPLAMWARATLAYGPGMGALAVLGAASICRRRRGWIIAATVVVYFGFHAACRFLGLYATGGYPRFLIAVSPLVAILAVAAVVALSEIDAKRWGLRVGVVAGAFVFFWLAAESEKPDWIYPPFVTAYRAVTVVLALTSIAVIVVERRTRLRWVRWLLPAALVSLTVLQTAHLTRPWRMSADQRSIARVVEWLKDHGYGDRPVVGTNVWVHYLWPVVLDPGEWHAEREIREAPPGTILLWDKRYSPVHPQEMPLARYVEDPNFHLLKKSWPAPGVFCYAFEKLPRGEGREEPNASSRSATTSAVPQSP